MVRRDAASELPVGSRSPHRSDAGTGAASDLDHALECPRLFALPRYAERLGVLLRSGRRTSRCKAVGAPAHFSGWREDCARTVPADLQRPSRRWSTGTGWALGSGDGARTRVGSWALILASLLVVGVGCTATGTDDSSARSLAERGCQWGPVAEDGGIEGEAANGEFWVLAPGLEMLRAGREFKVVFRLTGSGPADAVVVSPDGRQVEPTRPLRPHAGSNFDRPGEEWGAFFEVDEPGCWELVVEREGTTGVLPLPISAS